MGRRMGGGGRVVERLLNSATLWLLNGATLFTTPRHIGGRAAGMAIHWSVEAELYRFYSSASFLTKNSNFYYLD